MMLLVFWACGGATQANHLTLDQALERIDTAGRSSEPLTLTSLSEALGADLKKGDNQPGPPFVKVQISQPPQGPITARFFFESSTCFAEKAARERYGHLFANASAHLPWEGKEWVAQREGYRLTLGMDEGACVRRLGLSKSEP